MEGRLQPGRARRGGCDGEGGPRPAQGSKGCRKGGKARRKGSLTLCNEITSKTVGIDRFTESTPTDPRKALNGSAVSNRCHSNQLLLWVNEDSQKYLARPSSVHAHTFDLQQKHEGTAKKVKSKKKKMEAAQPPLTPIRPLTDVARFTLSKAEPNAGRELASSRSRCSCLTPGEENKSPTRDSNPQSLH